jgi:hypothetical protein
METSLRSVSGTTEKVDVPLMPYPKPLRTWAGHGTGATCNGCGGSIQAHEIEYEIELPADSNVMSLHFHFACYRSWTDRRVR